ncbi:hypothetical protein B0H11DRAFT_2254201 [Mycena galericulata]|nr:hypothetical protein B0H11DRAFT_2254201 [Mycena galericulata]
MIYQCRSRSRAGLRLLGAGAWALDGPCTKGAPPSKTGDLFTLIIITLSRFLPPPALLPLLLCTSSAPGSWRVDTWTSHLQAAVLLPAFKSSTDRWRRLRGAALRALFPGQQRAAPSLLPWCAPGPSLSLHRPSFLLICAVSPYTRCVPVPHASDTANLLGFYALPRGLSAHMSGTPSGPFRSASRPRWRMCWHAGYAASRQSTPFVPPQPVYSSTSPECSAATRLLATALPAQWGANPPVRCASSSRSLLSGTHVAPPSCSLRRPPARYAALPARYAGLPARHTAMPGRCAPISLVAPPAVRHCVCGPVLPPIRGTRLPGWLCSVLLAVN